MKITFTRISRPVELGPGCFAIACLLTLALLARLLVRTSGNW